MAEGSKAEERACSTLLHRLVLRVPKATLDIHAEDLFRAIFGLELDCGKLWRSKSLGAGVNQPEDPWEVRERLLHRLVLRGPKATLETLRAYGEDLFRAIFGLELDCGKLWRSKSLGAGVNQPEDLWEVRERLLYRLVLRVPKATAYGEDLPSYKLATVTDVVCVCTASSCYLHSNKFATVTDVVYVCTVVCSLLLPPFL